MYILPRSNYLWFGVLVVFKLKPSFLCFVSILLLLWIANLGLQLICIVRRRPSWTHLLTQHIWFIILISSSSSIVTDIILIAILPHLHLLFFISLMKQVLYNNNIIFFTNNRPPCNNLIVLQKTIVITISIMIIYGMDCISCSSNFFVFLLGIHFSDDLLVVFLVQILQV